MPQEMRTSAYWQPTPGQVSLARVIDYNGDDTDNREIDLGAFYDWIRITLHGEKSALDTMGMLAETTPGPNGVEALWVLNGTPLVGTAGHDECEDWYRGRLTPTSSIIRLGNVGDAVDGFNRLGWEYRITAYKFRSLIAS